MDEKLKEQNYVEELIEIIRSTKSNEELRDKLSDYHENDIADAFVRLDEEERKRLQDIYAAAGYPICFVSAKEQIGIETVKEQIEGKTFALAGPSGVGKSSLTNVLQSEIRMETGEISMKIERGKHTTRHSQVIPLSKNTYLMDTPGFSSMYMPGFEKEDLKDCYPEFVALEEQCRFTGCSHIHEPDCAVKEALSEGKISTERYENYCTLYEEIKDTKKY